MRLIRILILVLLVPVPASIAEYRAFELSIEDAESGKARKVITTLDHVQYSTYHPLNPNEQVSYVRSWMCWTNSDHEQEICPAPEENEITRMPSNEVQ